MVSRQEVRCPRYLFCCRLLAALILQTVMLRETSLNHTALNTLLERGRDYSQSRDKLLRVHVRKTMERESNHTLAVWPCNDWMVIERSAFYGRSGQTDFGPQLKSLNKDHFTIVAWDPRGYGRSIPPNREFPLEFFHRDAKDAVDLMQAKSVIDFQALNFSRFSMLGWSDGGITALIAAAQYTFHINKLVVWGSNAYITEDDIKLYNAVRDVSKWSERMRKPMEEMYGAEYFAKTWAAWVDGICQFAKRPDGNICREVLPQIHCPTLIVQGLKDPMVPNFHAEFLHKHIKGSRLHLMPEGKHNLHLRFSEEFNQVVEEFLLQ
ncbi:BPHL hydrolase, partial [Polyodon spathula]|nr:BPHL hydrolase [Polyodon spathula]